MNFHIKTYIFILLSSFNHNTLKNETSLKKTKIPRSNFNHKNPHKHRTQFRKDNKTMTRVKFPSDSITQLRA